MVCFMSVAPLLDSDWMMVVYLLSARALKNTINVLHIFDVHESVHCDTTMKITNKMHYTD
jgi:hypothetical protein